MDTKEKVNFSQKEKATCCIFVCLRILWSIPKKASFKKNPFKMFTSHLNTQETGDFHF